MSSNLDHAKQYLSALERMGPCDALRPFFAEEVVQIEYPNQLVRDGATRDLAAILEGCERGKKVVSEQRYEIRNAVAGENIVVLEVLWTGTLAVPVQSLSAGDQMTANFAVFLEFQDGKIVAQRNYDCFEPW